MEQLELRTTKTGQLLGIEVAAEESKVGRLDDRQDLGVSVAREDDIERVDVRRAVNEWVEQLLRDVALKQLAPVEIEIAHLFERRRVLRVTQAGHETGAQEVQRLQRLLVTRLDALDTDRTCDTRT